MQARNSGGSDSSEVLAQVCRLSLKLLPHRRSLFDEGSEAFLSGFGSAGGGAHRGTYGQLSRELFADRFVEQTLGELHRFRRAGGAFFPELDAAGPKTRFVDQFMVDTESMRFIGSVEC